MMLTILIALGHSNPLRRGLPRTSLTGLEDSALAEVWTSQIREEVLTFPRGARGRSQWRRRRSAWANIRRQKSASQRYAVIIVALVYQN